MEGYQAVGDPNYYNGWYLEFLLGNLNYLNNSNYHAKCTVSMVIKSYVKNK